MFEPYGLGMKAAEGFISGRRNQGHRLDIRILIIEIPPKKTNKI